MAGKIKRIIKLSATCKKNRYERRPDRTELKQTPTPTFTGHTIHLDIFQKITN